MGLSSRQHLYSIIQYVSNFILLFVFALATSRILYEWFFPRWLWLGRPFPTILLALGFSLIFFIIPLFFRSALSLAQSDPVFLLPLLLNLLVLFNPNVDLVQSRLVYFASIWLAAVFIIHRRRAIRLFPWFGLIFIIAGLLPIYLLTMPNTVGQADTFEFQVVVPQLGIAHPTGYPLYLLLAKLFTFLPIGSVAWRINLASAVFALAALTIIYLIILQLDYQPVPALLGAVAIGLIPTFWSQAIEAEVYTLQALIVAVALWYILEIGEWRLESANWRLPIILAVVIGLGLTNHLTTVFLIPATILAMIFALQKYGSLKAIYRLLISDYWLLPKLILATLIPLGLYAYLPLRWAAVNEDRMGFSRFVDWVVGGRFQGALQWSAWLNDPTRYEVTGRTFLDNWGSLNLILIVIGVVYLFRRRWRSTVLLLITWFSFSFYALNYYVPDLSVFLIPAHLIMGIFWAAGATSIVALSKWAIRRAARITNQSLTPRNQAIDSPIFILLIMPALILTITQWTQIERSDDGGLTQWGAAVLNLPLAQNAAILADSEKIAPLYYLQQAEGVRPDLDIMVLPDEAAYRAELNHRINQQTIYLARFLPGLEGSYHLRSVGPLTEVGTEPLTQLPQRATPLSLSWGEIDLIGYELGNEFEMGTTAVTLYWQANQPVTQLHHVYLRWEDQPTVTPGQHPANDDYPTLAWDIGEIVPDFHLLPNPVSSEKQSVGLQVAMAPPFTPANQLTWQTAAVIDISPTKKIVNIRPLRQQFNDIVLTGIDVPTAIRPQTPLPVTLMGIGNPNELRYQLSINSHQSPVSSLQSFSSARGKLPISNLQSPFIYQFELETDVENGRYSLMAQSEGGAICGWLRKATIACPLAEIDISGVPLPTDATNYEDKIALLSVELDNTQLQAGGQLSLNLRWQSLAAMDKDYTVFIQVLNDQDQIVGQVDAWPLQGTLPTSQWAAGQIITDPYRVQLDSNLPSGTYRLLIGWYLLADGRRLSILSSEGNPVDDRLVLPDLFVP